MSKRLTPTDTLSLGFMTFAFFLGAGNIIFPPLAGMMAGENMVPAMLGFLVTAVGLPLIGLIAVAKVGGGISTMTKLLPSWVGIAIAMAIYIVIGPAFATPRTGLVAYEIGVVPFLSEATDITQLLFTLVFFSVALLLALNPGKLMDIVGKILTPALIVLLLVLAASVVINPQDAIGAATGPWIEDAFSNGFLEGYMTMDALGALMFGTLIVDVLRRKGIEDKKAQARYLSIAALIAATGLTVVYVSLFFLGATSSVLGAGADNGGAILTAYVVQVFGQPGLVMLALVVGLACLTTAVGLISACSEFFNEVMPKLSYGQWATIMAVLCATVANVGLAQLISISIPVLFLIYPMAMALIFYAYARDNISQQKTVLTVLIATTAFVGLLSALNVAGFATPFVELFNFLPLFDKHLAWVPLTAVILIAGGFYKRGQAQLAEAK
ncbi:branched-chain amino acid transport system II carrier protein [Ferrimonas lipolytica]|uniref:Branched-chain amino acid transport system carrier protein n=1 Tax=Ferrimonas lipolytica TaxID=2724191 RepID=A0A6H1UEC1_9GAMM|nr:branched-chain amino acid transport system II carrier protein [Ferrimonas lipolytica]QIZ77457.1 branched-chain amino acid transport system II carrier protein [Ferrimonas lipolytica]